MKIELEQDVKGLLPERDYDRRDFIWTALGASAALAVASSAAGQQIVARVEPAVRTQPREKIRLTLIPDRIHFFDAKTEAVIK